MLLRPAVIAATLLAAAASVSLAGCSSTAELDHQHGKLAVAAAFYPLQFAVEQVGGSRVAVTSVTKPGAEPHDLELTPQDVVAIRQADLVVYEKGLQPAVDAAVSSGSVKTLDVAGAAHLDLAAPAEGQQPDPSAKDPHFWLDPSRYAAVGRAIADRLAQVDPSHAAQYRAGAARFTVALATLDGQLRAGLASCRHHEIVTGHAAFGYLAQRYGLTQRGIAGVSPDAEPDAATMRTAADQVRAQHATTVYAETLVSPALTETIARETGARVDVLDPIEGITSTSRGRDYFEVMRSNLATLRTGQECS